MKAKQFLFAATHPAGVAPPREPDKVNDQLMQQLKARAAQLPVEGELPSFAGATAWLNSEPLTPAGLRGKVVLVQFWTYTCVNWLRTLPYSRAWVEKYGDKGLGVIGVHTPEFPFEKDIDNIRKAANEMRVTYPIAVDSNYAVWRAFDNNYWPALYLADGQGRIRAHHFGEGAYDMSEMVIQQLLADAGLDSATNWYLSSQRAQRLPPTGAALSLRRAISATSRATILPHLEGLSRTRRIPIASRLGCARMIGPSRAFGRSRRRQRC